MVKAQARKVYGRTKVEPVTIHGVSRALDAVKAARKAALDFLAKLDALDGAAGGPVAKANAALAGGPFPLRLHPHVHYLPRDLAAGLKSIGAELNPEGGKPVTVHISQPDAASFEEYLARHAKDPTFKRALERASARIRRRR